jgi:rhamnosyltransferase
MILMSTYNGERYLDQQLRSIYNQLGVKITLYIRDDGSKDNTIKIIENWVDKLNIILDKGENLGPSRSFLKMLEDSPRSKYYAFADQDDYWLPEKLYQAIQKLEMFNQNDLNLYISNTTLVNANLEPIKSEVMRKDIDFAPALIYNPATGCTMVFNDHVKELVTKYEVSVEMHDAWIYRIVSFVNGNIYYDTNSYILYRQHTNNVIGGNQTIFKKYKRRFDNFRKKTRKREKMALSLYQLYSDFSTTENEKICHSVAFYRNSLNSRIKLIFNSKMRFSTIKKKVLFIVVVLFGRL